MAAKPISWKSSNSAQATVNPAQKRSSHPTRRGSRTGGETALTIGFECHSASLVVVYWPSRTVGPESM